MSSATKQYRDHIQSTKRIRETWFVSLMGINKQRSSEIHVYGRYVGRKIMGVGEIEVYGKRNAPSRRYTSDSSVKHIVHVNVLRGDG